MITIKTTRNKAVSTFILGMMAGALIVAGGLVVAREHRAAVPQPVLLDSVTTIPRASATAVSAPPAPVSEVPQAPLELELPRAMVIGHRLKLMVQASPAAAANVA